MATCYFYAKLFYLTISLLKHILHCSVFTAILTGHVILFTCGYWFYPVHVLNLIKRHRSADEDVSRITSPVLLVFRSQTTRKSRRLNPASYEFCSLKLLGELLLSRIFSEFPDNHSRQRYGLSCLKTWHETRARTINWQISRLTL